MSTKQLELNPQAEQMAAESMVRTLQAQAIATWPQEKALFEAYGLKGSIRILDVGCGTGEITSRLANLYPDAELIGIDLLDGPLRVARDRHIGLVQRMKFQQGDAYALEFADDSFDLVVCRHMLQAVPRADDIIRELVRVARPVGRLHLLNEDYGMIHVQPGELNPDDLWRNGVFEYMNRTGTDARIGLSTFELLGELDLSDIRIDYLTIDTIRVDRNVFAAIMRAWRDGYSETLSAHSDLDAGTVRALFDQIIDTIMDENKYAVWHVPIISGLV